MIPVFFDTSGAIALLNQKDPHHAKAVRLSELFIRESRPMVTTTVVLAELGDGFAQRRRWDLVSPFLASSFRDPLIKILPLDQSLVERAAAFRDMRQDKEWGMTDCASFLVMADLGLQEALTADHHFRQAGFRALLLEE